MTNTKDDAFSNLSWDKAIMKSISTRNSAPRGLYLRTEIYYQTNVFAS